MLTFTAGQIIAIFIVTEIIVYAMLSKIMDTIKSCSISKTYREVYKHNVKLENFDIINAVDNKEE